MASLLSCCFSTWRPPPASKCKHPEDVPTRRQSSKALSTAQALHMLACPLIQLVVRVRGQLQCTALCAAVLPPLLYYQVWLFLPVLLAGDPRYTRDFTGSWLWNQSIEELQSALLATRKGQKSNSPAFCNCQAPTSHRRSSLMSADSFQVQILGIQQLD